MTKLNRATYAILLDVSPIVDPENNVLQHYMESDIVQLGLWGNVVEKNMRVKGTDFENLGFSFELPKSLMGIRGAVRVMRVEYDHYSKVRNLVSMVPINDCLDYKFSSRIEMSLLLHSSDPS